ncbi:MAG: hypothetical protein CEE40_11370 [Chloroflexi bacterium B3_Chlor]|nr:MAG: hypothetical protein CEE40_11370 [Chloroflexi bacterium B3_Chlor]
MSEAPPPLCDYEGYDYRGEFWVGRDYEDVVERIALRKLLPAKGGRLVEIGAAYGRLADLYAGYEEVILLDPAKSQLREAQKRRGGDGRFVYVVGDAYSLPLSTSGFDVAVTVRVLHHLTQVPAAFREIHRILRPDGRYILEYANKRNLKEIVRYLAGRSQKAPLAHQPVEYAPLHFSFHPAFIDEELRESDFQVERTLAVSSLRLDALKRLVPLAWLIRVDALLQAPTAALRLSPSIFLAARAVKEQQGSGGIFRCPSCGSEDLEEGGSALLCRGCGRHWSIEDGIYDFGVG